MAVNEEEILGNFRQDQYPQKSKGKGGKVAIALLIAILLVFTVIAIPIGIPFLINFFNSQSIIPIYPENSAIVTNSTIVFQWKAPNDITEFRFQLSKVPSFRTQIVNVTVNETSYSLQSELEKNKTYYWRVMPQDGREKWSATWDFFYGHGAFQRVFEWHYKGNLYSITVNIAGEDYYTYSLRERVSNYASYVISDDQSVNEVAYKLNHIAVEELRLSSYKKAEFILAFVQSMKYMLDNQTKGMIEYPRYPVETLVDGGGDCEDSAILFVSIIQNAIFNFDGVLLLFEGDPGHMAAGIWGDRTLSGTAYVYNGKYYYYCETTSPGWIIGQIPEEFEGKFPKIIPC